MKSTDAPKARNASSKNFEGTSTIDKSLEMIADNAIPKVNSAVNKSTSDKRKPAIRSHLSKLVSSSQ